MTSNVVKMAFRHLLMTETVANLYFQERKKKITGLVKKLSGDATFINKNPSVSYVA